MCEYTLTLRMAQARYNDLMTQSDKDFITRIQVSQLVTQDPYSEDFYAQIYGAIMRSKMGLQVHDHRVLNFGSGGGVGLGMSQRPSGRRASAMQKMEAQVEKIVQAARIREKEKGVSCEYFSTDVWHTPTPSLTLSIKHSIAYKAPWGRRRDVATKPRLVSSYKLTRKGMKMTASLLRKRLRRWGTRLSAILAR